MKVLVVILFMGTLFLFYQDYSLKQKKDELQNQISTLKQEKNDYTLPSRLYVLPSYSSSIEKMARFLYLKTSLEGIKLSIQEQTREKHRGLRQNKKEIIKKQYIISLSGPIEQTCSIIKTLFFAFPMVLKEMNAGKNNVHLTIDFYGKNDNGNNPS